MPAIVASRQSKLWPPQWKSDKYSPDHIICCRHIRPSASQWCTTMRSFSLKRYGLLGCYVWDLWRVLYLPARQCSCSPSARDYCSGNLQERNTCIHFARPFATQHHRSERGWVQNTRWNVAVWSSKFMPLMNWTEAVLDRCLASFRVKCYRWRSW